MEKVLRFIDDERARFVAELSAWVKIPAISSDPKHKEDMQKNAEHLAAELKRLKADRVEIWPTGGGKFSIFCCRAISSACRASSPTTPRMASRR